MDAFGKNKQGDAARIISAIANLVLTVAMISYFAVGAGKFAGEFLDINWRVASLGMAALATIYTVASGLYGVVWTDVFQGVFIFVVIIYIVAKAMTLVDLPDEFLISVPLAEGGFHTIQTSLENWTRVIPPLELELPGVYSIYNLFGIAIFFYLFRVTLEGSGGGSGYMVQRYFAAKSDKEVGLLSLFWTFLLMFRWPLIAALAMLGVYYGMTEQVIADPELVLPTVINNFIPVGIKGLLIGGFIAAAMSTFDSTVNAGAAYWVKDIYQAYINPDADEKKLIIHSKVSSLLIVTIGMLFSFAIANINEIWGWITMGVSGGIFIPMVLRWYWWRFNGFGFAVGTITGLTAAVLAKLFLGGSTEYLLFILTSVSSLAGCIIATYLTSKTENKVLEHFYKTTRPFGLWSSVRKQLKLSTQEKIDRENRKDIIATFIAVPWQIILFLSGILFVLKQWDKFFILFIILIILSIALYFTWFRRLSEEVKMD